MGQFEGALEKLRFKYQKLKRELDKTEGQYLKTPTNILAHEVVSIQGELRGMMLAIDVLETFQGTLELPKPGTGIH